MAATSSGSHTSGTSSSQVLISTLRWLSALVFLLTGSLTWQLLSKSQYAQDWLDIPLPCTITNVCEAEYQRVTRDRTKGLTKDDLERSRAHVGNRYRLAVLSQKLQQQVEPVTAVVCGGSISIGHGVVP
jgi:hypothetical protein